METLEKPGREMHNASEDARRQAAALMGSARTERKADAARANVVKAIEAVRGKPMSQEHKDKIAAARQAQEQERKAQAVAPPAKEKKRAGRPMGSKNKRKQEGEQAAG